WLTIWSVEGLLALAIGWYSVARKARSVGMPLLSGPGRKVALILLPPLVAGAVLTAVLYQDGQLGRLPGMWLLLFGAGIVAAGAFSVRIVPVMGLAFMLLGTAAFALPAAWGHGVLGLGSGRLHVFVGFLVAGGAGGYATAPLGGARTSAPAPERAGRCRRCRPRRFRPPHPRTDPVGNRQ